VPFSGRFYPYGVTFLSESGELRVSVVDAVGNRSPSATFVLPACLVPGVVVDAGPSGGRPDASAPADASTSDAGAAIDVGQPAGDDSGCALGRTNGTGALWLALSLVLARRKNH
jgi:hypothetical protein